MSEEKNLFTEEVKSFLLKIIVPSLVAVSIKLAVMSRNGKISMFNVIVSLITGVGSAYLFADYVMSSFSHQYIPLVIALITFSGEKIGVYFIVKFNVEEFISTLLTKFKK